MAKTGEVERAKTSPERDNQYVNIAIDSFESSVSTYRPQYIKFDRWYRLYRGYRQGRAIRYRNNITIPLAFSMIQSGLARKTDITSATNPRVVFDAVGPEDSLIANKRTNLIGIQFEDADWEMKELQLMLSGEIYGTEIAKTHWDLQRELVTMRADLGQGEKAFAGEQFTFDGPNITPVNVRNFFPQPGPTTIKNMRWVCHRYHLDIETVNRLAESGFYLKRGAANLRGSGGGPPKQSSDDILATTEDPASGLPMEGFTRPDYDRPVEIIEWWGRVPRSLSKDGQVNFVITVGNRNTLLRAEPSPYPYIPFLDSGPIPEADYFWRPSKLEVIEKVAYAANALASQKADATSLTVDPQYIYNGRTTSRPRRLWSRPGAVHRWEGPVDDSNFRPLTPDLRGLVNAYQETEQYAQWMEQGSGVIRDAIQGFSGPDRETARGFLGRMRSANVRLNMELRIFERTMTEKVAQRFVDLNRRYLEFPQQLRMMGTAALVDPVLMRPLPPSARVMTVNDFLPDYQARATGATRAATREVVFQTMLQLMQVAQTNPVGIAVVNWITYFRQLFDAAGVPNPDDLLNTSGIIEQIAAQAGISHGDASGQPGQVDSTPNQLPDLGAAS